MKYIFLLFWSFAIGQQSQFVDFTSVSANLKLEPNEKAISGSVTYIFTVLNPIDTISIDAQKMMFSNVELNDRYVKFSNTGKQLKIIYPFRKGQNEISFNFSAKPKQGLYFIGNHPNDNFQVWTQGQGKNTSNWFPSFDDVNEKLVFNLGISFDSDYQVISNGVLKNKIEVEDKFFWQYEMDKPMSSYLLMLAVGKFQINSSMSETGIPLEYYIEKKDTLKFESTYRYSKRIFDFLQKEIGVDYPWQIYRQIPVRDFLYAGMENTTSTLFSNRYVVDDIGFTDNSYTNVDAHELAHQWFGNLITAENGKHHWLQEGFATYFSLLAEKDLFGADYYYSKLYEMAKQVNAASKTDTIPILNEKASSLSYYQKGALTLFFLKESIGEEKFKKAIKNFLNNHAFKTVNTNDFLEEVKNVDDFNSENYSKEWLETSDFNFEKIKDLLEENYIVKQLIEIEERKAIPISEKEKYFETILEYNRSSKVKVAVINEVRNLKFENKKKFLELALASNDVIVRQAVAFSLSKIPEEFRIPYESLLDDNSYLTREIALFNLWKNFPKFRVNYLVKTSTWIGFKDYNLRILWLSLAISTTDFLNNKQVLIQELINYSSPVYEVAIRENALEKLIYFQLINETVLKNLVNGTTHHMWQFSKFSRDNIRVLLKNSFFKETFQNILLKLNEEEQFQLQRLLNES